MPQKKGLKQKVKLLQGSGNILKYINCCSNKPESRKEEFATSSDVFETSNLFKNISEEEKTLVEFPQTKTKRIEGTLGVYRTI